MTPWTNVRVSAALVVAVTALLVVVAIAARHGAFGNTHTKQGPSAGFMDYAFTTFMLGIAIVLLLLVNEARRARRVSFTVQRYPLWLTMAVFLAVSFLGILALRALHVVRALQRYEAQHVPKGGHANRQKYLPKTQGGKAAVIRWDEVAIVGGIAAAALVVIILRRQATRPERAFPELLAAQDLSRLLDDTVDDLRRDADLRRAIIAAYARMERVLAVRGLPRRPSEAPLEFLDRALRELRTSAAGIRRLTELFEWAKFSQHEPTQRMRDEAVDALVSVRDELRTPVAV